MLLKRFLEFHPRASLYSKLVLSFRSSIWLHVLLAFLPWLCNQAFPEMIIDWSSEKKTDVIKEKLLNVLPSRSSEDGKQSLNFMMCITHTCNWDDWNMVEVTQLLLQWAWWNQLSRPWNSGVTTQRLMKHGLRDYTPLCHWKIKNNLTEWLLQFQGSMNWWVAIYNYEENLNTITIHHLPHNSVKLHYNAKS